MKLQSISTGSSLLDLNTKQKFQTAILDNIGTEHNWLRPRGTHKYEVFPVEAKIPHFGPQITLKMLHHKLDQLVNFQSSIRVCPSTFEYAPHLAWQGASVTAQHTHSSKLHQTFALTLHALKYYILHVNTTQYICKQWQQSSYLHGRECMAWTST